MSKVLTPLTQPWEFSGIALTRSFSSSLFFIFLSFQKKTLLKWLCMKIPLSAKRVVWGVWFGGMFRGMFRRYDSGYDSPHLLYCLHKDYILYQRALSYTKLATGVVFWRGRLGHGTAKRGLGMIRGMYRVWFAVWLGQETVFAKIK